jgi:hypothetical protein
MNISAKITYKNLKFLVSITFLFCRKLVSKSKIEIQINRYNEDI